MHSSTRPVTRRRSGALRLVLIAAGPAFLAAVALSCGGSSPSSPATPTAAETPAPSSTTWLCKPGLADNPCEADLTATAIAADGTEKTESASPAKEPPIDCFYVYPTVSSQPTANADLAIDPEETAVAVFQASRFSQVCKVYAPMYRQITRAGITAILSGEMPAGQALTAAATAYGDVLSAWQDYLAHYNHGRGVVLIGHSQGTLMLTHLVTTEIDSNPEVRKLLVSALLIGGNVMVAQGQDTGGDFQNVAACRSAGQTGCVVAYSSYLETPPADSLFGRPHGGIRNNEFVGKEVEVLCVNPAAVSGGSGPLDPYFPTASFPGLGGAATGGTPSPSTPWVTYPGLYTGHCESAGGANWLQVDTTNLPGDQRPVVTEALGPAWGLHLVDVNIALGNLVDLVRRQAAAFSN
jgi:hypothetical protein